MPQPLILANGTTLNLAPLSGVMTPVLTSYSARGVTVTLEVIGGVHGSAQLRRDVNGFLRDFSDHRFRKYQLTVTCRDGEAPCLDGAWLGAVVTVDVPAEISYPTGGSPQRPVVSGSSRTQGSFTYYRPQLTMMVSEIMDATQEYAAIHSWTIKLEEV